MQPFAVAEAAAKAAVKGPFFWRSAWRFKAFMDDESFMRLRGPFGDKDAAARAAGHIRIKAGLIAAGVQPARAASLASTWFTKKDSRRTGYGSGLVWGYKIALRYETWDSPETRAAIDRIVERIRASAAGTPVDASAEDDEVVLAMLHIGEAAPTT